MDYVRGHRTLFCVKTTWTKLCIECALKRTTTLEVNAKYLDLNWSVQFQMVVLYNDHFLFLFFWSQVVILKASDKFVVRSDYQQGMSGCYWIKHLGRYLKKERQFYGRQIQNSSSNTLQLLWSFSFTQFWVHSLKDILNYLFSCFIHDTQHGSIFL